MKRAGGGIDDAYNAQTAVDETAHTVEQADKVLADAGSRSEAVMAAKFETEQGNRQY